MYPCVVDISIFDPQNRSQVEFDHTTQHKHYVYVYREHSKANKIETSIVTVFSNQDKWANVRCLSHLLVHGQRYQHE
jgi:hypothetical protein